MGYGISEQKINGVWDIETPYTSLIDDAKRNDIIKGSLRNKTDKARLNFKKK